jgi:uncharacterized low-complexity protein
MIGVDKMPKNTMTPVATLIGAAVVGSLSMANLAQAADNPFAAEQLSGGSLILASEGSCGEGKCGNKGDGEGKCGGKGDAEGKCGEGKCGEGKCGNAS